MNTIQKGVIAEQKVILRAIELGYKVSKPLCDTRYDLILDDGKSLKRVQVKYGDGDPRSSEGSIVVGLRCRSYEKNRNDRTSTYSTSDVDDIMVYIPKKDVVVRLPQEAIGKTAVHLRFEPSKNKQIKGVHLIDELTW